MAKQAWEAMVAYKLVWVRVILFLLTPMITSYLAITQTIDMDIKWPTMGPFSRFGFWLGIASPGIGTFIAFLDQSLGRAKHELEQRRGDTQFFGKDTGP